MQLYESTKAKFEIFEEAFEDFSNYLTLLADQAGKVSEPKGNYADFLVMLKPD